MCSARFQRLIDLTLLQNRFRIAVGVRDSQCLITDVDYESCTACHIVPQSREDVSVGHPQHAGSKGSYHYPARLRSLLQMHCS